MVRSLKELLYSVNKCVYGVNRCLLYVNSYTDRGKQISDSFLTADPATMSKLIILTDFLSLFSSFFYFEKKKNLTFEKSCARN